MTQMTRIQVSFVVYYKDYTSILTHTLLPAGQTLG